MLRQEILQLIYITKATYPKAFERYTQADYSNMELAWSMVLGDYNYAQASMGLKTFLASDTKGFPPSPGQIVECIRKASRHPDDDILAAEAWEMVWRAIGDVRWDKPEEEYDKLPKKIQKIIGSAVALAEMAKMPTNDILIGEKARFIHQYDAYTEREAEYQKIPQEFRPAIEMKRRVEVIEDKSGEQKQETKAEMKKAQNGMSENNAKKLEELRRRLHG